MATDTALISQRGWHYTLRRSHRARRLRLSYGPDSGLAIVLPRAATRADAEAFLLAQEAWVCRCHAADPVGLNRPRPVPPVPGHVALPAIAQSVETEGVTTLEELHELLRLRAKEELPAWVARLAAQTGLPYARVSVRNQRSRWGSYSSKGTLSLNWRLLLMTPDMVDYVVLHELAHSRHLDHSARFWRLLESICPDARRRDREFDRRAAELLPAWARAKAA